MESFFAAAGVEDLAAALGGASAIFGGSAARLAGLTVDFTFIGNGGGVSASTFLRGAGFFSSGSGAALAAAGLRLKSEDNFSFTLLSVCLAGALVLVLVVWRLFQRLCCISVHIGIFSATMQGLI